MFARMFPLNVERIVHDAYDGALSTLVSLPVSISIHLATHFLSDICIDYVPEEVAERCVRRLEAQKQLIAENDTKAFLTRFAMPVIEEFLFRGALTPGLQAVLSSMNLDASYAPLLSSMIFASMHQVDQPMMLYLGHRFEGLTSSHDGSLWPSITAHSLYNIAIMLLSPTTDRQRQLYDEKIEHIKTVNPLVRLRLLRQRMEYLSRQEIDELTAAYIKSRERRVASVAMGSP